MKKAAMAILLMFLIGTSVKAQILTPVKWSYLAKKTSPTEAIVFLKATIDDGWHIYSQNMAEAGPTKTVFTYAPSKFFVLAGKTIEPRAISHFDKNFNMQIGFFEHQVIFQQKIKLKSAGKTIVKGTLEYGTCNDHQCLPPQDIEFNIPVV